MSRVLVVDDSALMRKLLGGILERAGFDVVTARNGIDALVQVEREDPDVVTLDINMPEMDGLTCLARLMREHPVPVVMVSSLTEHGTLATLEALELGAVDYVPKPDGTVSLGVERVAAELVDKTRAAAAARPRRRDGLLERLRRDRQVVAGSGAASKAGRVSAVLIGASTGGPAVLPDVVGALPAGFRAPIVIAQHIPRGFSRHLAERLDSVAQVMVSEVSEVTPLVAGHVYVAPGEDDVIVAERAGKAVVRPVPVEASLRWHPSVERLVRSAMEVFSPTELIGVQLTGMGDDGAAAMSDLQANGGRTIAQSEQSAVVWGMPGELVRRGGATCVLDVEEIAAQLAAWTN